MTNASLSPFVLAVPSKGRMQENAAQFFARAGLSFVQGRGARDYRGSVPGFEGLEVAFLPVSEIVANLADGSVHLGIAGEDLIREAMNDADQRVELLAPLGFGQANVVVAVPQAWIDVRTMADLEDVAAIFHARHGRRMRVATKYLNLTRRYFAEHGVVDYRIVESLGATEGAPAAGTAELIVDITTTGATLAANGLKVLDDGVILRSEANLVAALGAEWGDQHRSKARAVLSRIAAEEAARQTREVRAQLSGKPIGLTPDIATRFGAVALDHQIDAGSLAFRCDRRQAAAFADWLIDGGASQVSVHASDYLFAAENALFDRLVGRIG